MPSTDPASDDNHLLVNTTNQSPGQTFSHKVSHSVSTGNGNIGHQPSTHYDDSADDDFDAAVMNVDLDIDMFKDNIDLDMFEDNHENHANQEGRNHQHETSPSNMASAHLSCVEIKTIGEILTIFNDNSICRTLHTKVQCLHDSKSRVVKREVPLET